MYDYVTVKLYGCTGRNFNSSGEFHSEQLADLQAPLAYCGHLLLYNTKHILYLIREYDTNI